MECLLVKRANKSFDEAAERINKRDVGIYSNPAVGKE